MNSEPTQQAPSSKRSVYRVLGWSVLGAVVGAIIYWAFSALTHAEASLIGIPAGIAVGQCVYYASGGRGGRRYQKLAILIAFAAFDLSYAPGIAGVAFKHGITLLTFGFFVFITLVSPVIDSHNGFLGWFMIVTGMSLAWTLARSRSPIDEPPIGRARG
ncbi:MAG: hypothetical protein ABSG23_17165 [Terriglobales bacterium]|jgi:hypothetical protein